MPDSASWRVVPKSELKDYVFKAYKYNRKAGQAFAIRITEYRWDTNYRNTETDEVVGGDNIGGLARMSEKDVKALQRALDMPREIVRDGFTRPAGAEGSQGSSGGGGSQRQEGNRSGGGSRNGGYSGRGPPKPGAAVCSTMRTLVTPSDGASKNSWRLSFSMRSPSETRSPSPRSRWRPITPSTAHRSPNPPRHG